MTDGPVFTESPDGERILDQASQSVVRSPLEGAGMAQDFFDAFSKAASGDWTEGIVNLAAGATGVREFAADPFGKLVSMGLGWVIEHVGWLREPLDWLAGDQVRLDTMAATWNGIGDELASAAADLDGYYRTDAHDWVGDTADQYREFCANRVDAYTCLAHSSKTISVVVSMSKVILAVVRTVVRDLITDFVGRTISRLLRYPPPTTPAAIPELVSLATTYSQRIMDWVAKLRKAFGNAKALLAEVLGKLRSLPKQFLAGSKKLGQSLAARHTFAAMYAKSADKLGGTAADVTSHYARGFLADAPKEFVDSALGKAASATAKAGVSELPGKISTETAKATAKAGAAEVDADLEPEPGPGVAPGRPVDAPAEQESYLVGGRSAHRVSGELEES